MKMFLTCQKKNPWKHLHTFGINSWINFCDHASICDNPRLRWEGGWEGVLFAEKTSFMWNTYQLQLFWVKRRNQWASVQCLSETFLNPIRYNTNNLWIIDFKSEGSFTLLESDSECDVFKMPKKKKKSSNCCHNFNFTSNLVTEHVTPVTVTSFRFKIIKLWQRRRRRNIQTIGSTQWEMPPEAQNRHDWPQIKS